MFNKALNLPADSLILDLEDSVAPDRKVQARLQVCDWIRQADFGGREKLVRINPLESEWGRDDLEAITAAGPDGIVVPKVMSVADVEAIDRLLIALELDREREAGSTPLVLIGTEGPAAVFRLPDTLAHGRVEAVAWGAEDLAAELGARAKRDAQGDYLEVFSVVRSLCLLAATGAGVQPIDAPFVDIKDSEALRRECRLTADMGYTGKLTIHPAQIEIVNQAFMPTAAEVELARELLGAFEKSQQEGRMAFTFRGEMVDVPHLKKARNVLARASLKDGKR
jgi:citrate lyase subunit beta/citryl-CoA lyase